MGGAEAEVHEEAHAAVAGGDWWGRLEVIGPGTGFRSQGSLFSSLLEVSPESGTGSFSHPSALIPL